MICMCGGFIGDLFDTVTDVVSGIFGGGDDDYAPPTIQMQPEEVKTPQQLNLSQENTAQTALEQSLEADQRRGLQSNIQTSGSGTALGEATRKKLLGG